jgi:hypothetical protein
MPKGESDKAWIAVGFKEKEMKNPVTRFIGSMLVGLVGVCCGAGGEAQAQMQSAAGTSTGMGLVPQGYGFGLGSGVPGVMAVPTYPMTGTSRGTGLNPALTDPLGLGYVYGPAVPMTPTQAGLFMLSAQQRMFGLGNGQISGTRPASDLDARSTRTGRTAANSAGSHLTAAHTRNSNIPGGQAARFFNRGVASAPSSQPYYKRQMRYFPQTTQ